MADEIFGNSRGLAPSELRSVRKLYQRSVDATELVSLELAREMLLVAQELRRRIGVLINRQGRVEAVILGTKEIIYLPDLGRYRLGRSRLRNVRLVFTDLSRDKEQAAIPYDVYADLERLRFDVVASVRSAPNRVSMSFAYLVPAKGMETATTMTEEVKDLGAYQDNFLERIEAIEQSLASEVVQLDSDEVGAVLVGVYDKGDLDPQSSMLELRELARTAGVTVVDSIVQRRRIDPKTFLGSGKLQELVIRCLRLGAEVLIFDAELKPSQWRSITNSTELKVIDRSMLILDIFAQRAQSADGRLQVELAQLKYNLPRLVEKDAGLSRLSGGIGGRGPGETKLELGRRTIRDRISELERRLSKVRQSRDFRRGRRRENQMQLVSVVGYTNVGKSTLFNLLTGSQVLAENKLFATLDPSQRRLFLPTSSTAEVQDAAGRMVVLSDTVGFIRKLPVELETAFRATLEELYDAALLVHVVDASDPDAIGKYQAVRKIVDQMSLAQAPELVVVNKIDAVPPAVYEPLCRQLQAVPVSAAKKTGIAALLAAIDARVPRQAFESASNQRTQ
ncbi:MAG: GTPase HflX [Pseudomonadota bacterium]|jgi:GTP-binding protein HflX